METDTAVVQGSRLHMQTATELGIIIHMVLVLPGMWEVRSVSVKDASPEILE